MPAKKAVPRILSVSEYLPNQIKINVTKRVIDFFFPAHGHEFYEIEFVTDGRARYIVNNKEFTLEKGSLYFVTPADIHRVEVLDSSTATVINIQFDEKSVEPSLMLSFLNLSRDACCKLDGADFSSALELFNLLYREYCGKKEYKNICLKNYLENILILFLRTYTKSGFITDDENKSMSRAVVYVHSKFREGITLKQAAEFCGFAPQYFSSKFHAHTGMTFKEYVDRLRLSYAENLLKSTSLSITEICFSSGFKNVSSFIRRFGEKHGISPSKYRQDRN